MPLQAPLAGFALPSSNTTYTPNQFFDVCLPHCSRGTVRLVGYLIRKTLGWCDADGNPITERHTVSYSDLEVAGISRDMIRQALDEAIEKHFIRCIRQAKADSVGQARVSGQYELKWDERAEYVKDPREFRGFFAGEGNRTYIPNQFFDHVVASETLSVVKVVGAVVRLSIGFQNKWGNRRRDVALSFQHIQNYTRVGDRKTVSQALKHAIAANYVERVQEGYFDPDGGKRSRAAVYALKWAEVPLIGAVDAVTSQKTPPVENSVKNQSENPTGTGQKTPPADRSENPTGIEIKQRNKTLKQQPAAAVTFERLRAEGFDAQAAQAIANRWSAERIERQLRWIDQRRIKANRLGMLRKAIEQDWAAPMGGSTGGDRSQLRRRNWPVRASGGSFGDALEQAQKRLLGATDSNASSAGELKH